MHGDVAARDLAPQGRPSRTSARTNISSPSLQEKDATRRTSSTFLLPRILILVVVLLYKKVPQLSNDNHLASPLIQLKPIQWRENEGRMIASGREDIALVLEIMPQDPAEQNTQYREENRQQANRTANFQPEPAEIEHPEEQQPSVRATTPWQATWIEELAPTASFDDFDSL
ncbi:unnamed protein product [Caretta caretta]